MSDTDNLVQLKLCIPPLRTKIMLASPWKLKLYHERRNSSVFDNLGISQSHGYPIVKFTKITIPTNTKLSVDRIYIRNGCGAFDSVTFRIAKKDCPNDVRFEKTRFWAKLNDVNQIVCYPIGSNPENQEVFQSFILPGQRMLEV